MKDVLNWLLTDKTAQTVLLSIFTYLAAMLGALLTYLFASSKGLETTVPKLKQLFPGKSDTFYYRFDFFLVIILGSAVGCLFFTPPLPMQGLAAGCGWVSALNVLLQQKPKFPNGLAATADATETKP